MMQGGPRIIIPKGEPEVAFIVNRWHVTRPGAKILCNLPFGDGLFRAQRRAELSQVLAGNQMCPMCMFILEARITMVQGVFERLQEQPVKVKGHYEN